MTLDTVSLNDLRNNYMRAQLDITDADADPMQMFARWMDEARHTQTHEPNAMTLATVDEQQRPSARIVLLKEFGPSGLVWYTNYKSKKGHDLAQNAHAALLFYWPELERQVRFEGQVQKVPRAQSEQYFNSRPLGSRIGAIASQQSAVIASRDLLEKQFDEASGSAGDNPVCPTGWGGYILSPNRVEFWQGRTSRLHDRLVYDKAMPGNAAAAEWAVQRLQP